MLNLYKNILRPVAFRRDAEKIHELGLRALRVSLSSKAAQRLALKIYTSPKTQAVKRFGLEFSNPVGMAAGFDKNAAVVDQLGALGFGFVEVGTVTANPQPGNEKPRLFRLPKDNALINRLGFNNLGAAVAASKLAMSRRNCVIGVNIGKNKNVPNEEAVPNYLEALDAVIDYADYIAVNVSSPNTPDLRALQEAKKLDELLEAISGRMLQHAEKTASSPKPLLLKIAPDLSEKALDEVVDICLDRELNGIIATNTTIERNGLTASKTQIDKIGPGGLSGVPLQTRANEVIRYIYTRAGSSLPIVGVGGVFDAADAFEKISYGACLIQGYTGFVYGGPSYAREINRGLSRLLESKGFGSLDDAIGCAI
jgi:dihydroorotate dehydrogenase